MAILEDGCFFHIRISLRWVIGVLISERQNSENHTLIHVNAATGAIGSLSRPKTILTHRHVAQVVLSNAACTSPFFTRPCSNRVTEAPIRLYFLPSSTPNSV